MGYRHLRERSFYEKTPEVKNKCPVVEDRYHCCKSNAKTSMYVDRV